MKRFAISFVALLAVAALVAIRVGSTSTQVNLAFQNLITAAVQFGSVATGTSPPTCTPGTGGVFCANEGTEPTAASGVDQVAADSTLHDFGVQVNGGAAGILRHTLGSAIETTQTGSLGLTTICAASAGACNQAGLYHVEWNMWGSGTACSSVTAGTVYVTLTWHDKAGTSKSIKAPMWVSTSATAGTYVLTGFHFETSLANEEATGYYNLSSDGSTAIAFTTTYTACTTGTGTYNIAASVVRGQ